MSEHVRHLLKQPEDINNRDDDGQFSNCCDVRFCVDNSEHFWQKMQKRGSEHCRNAERDEEVENELHRRFGEPFRADDDSDASHGHHRYQRVCQRGVAPRLGFRLIFHSVF